MRALPFLVLSACSASPALSIQAYLQATTCDGAPCTHVDITVVDDVGGTAPETTAWMSVDGEAPIEVPRDAGGHTIDMPRWVQRVQITATSLDETVEVFGSNHLSSPFEMSPSLPETVTVGSTPHLTWRGQGSPARATVLFSTKVPALRFGFVETEGEDDGDLAIESIFTAVGEYNIALYRSAEFGGITWGSNWQQKVFAIVDPN
jgi:hypothetical protein